MNVENMRIELTESGFTVAYHCGVISEADVNCNTGIITFSFSDGNVAKVDISDVVELSKAYNRQFGIALTDDGARFLVQNWETGLFCFETQTGKLLWHNPQKKACQLATKDDLVLCHYQGQSICTLDIETGTIIRKYSFTTGITFKPLSRNYYLVGPKRGNYEILDSKLQRQVKLPVAKLNPRALDTFIIEDAALTKNGITISGVEYTGASFIAAVRAGESSEFIENSRFLRQIPLCIPSENTSI